jgi:hypothetical protein
MILEALGSALLGFALAWAAAYRLPHRLPGRRLVLSTGAAGGLFGAFLAHGAVETGHVVVSLLAAAAVAAASVSLLLRPEKRFRRRHSATA